MSCACGFALAEHATVFESRRERRGRRNTNLCGGGGLGTAAAGGVPTQLSLVLFSFRQSWGRFSYGENRKGQWEVGFAFIHQK